MQLYSESPAARSSNEKLNVPGMERKRFSLSLQFVLFGPSMDETMPPYVGEDRSSLCSLLIQMLISSQSAHTEALRNSVLLATYSSLTTGTLPHEINDHKFHAGFT